MQGPFKVCDFWSCSELLVFKAGSYISHEGTGLEFQKEEGAFQAPRCTWIPACGWGLLFYPSLGSLSPAQNQNLFHLPFPPILSSKFSIRLEPNISLSDLFLTALKFISRATEIPFLKKIKNTLKIKHFLFFSYHFFFTHIHKFLQSYSQSGDLILHNENFT